MDAEMIRKMEEARELLLEPEAFDRLVAKYEADPSEETLRAVLDQLAIEIAKGRVKGMSSDSDPS